MNIFGVIAERKIQEAMEEGLFDGLEGTGRPLPAEDDAGQDPAQRMAHRIMKNAGVTPEWIAEAREIERETRRLEGAAGEERLRRIDELNRRIALFNLKVPVRSAQKLPAR
ncbi:MAG: DUF1992 domain-containing protein [Acidobacteriota bacterium]|nr:DUF1992 domain-containing protein [Acidobacteriota bacterium]